MTLAEFLLARIAEDEAVARWAQADAWDETAGIHGFEDPWPSHLAFAEHLTPARVLAECEAKRQIVEMHKSWPVLVEGPPKFEPVDNSDFNSFTMRASQQMAWTTEQAYRDHFGTEPPTGPVLRFLALPYADHPDFDESWRP